MRIAVTRGLRLGSAERRLGLALIRPVLAGVLALGLWGCASGPPDRSLPFAMPASFSSPPRGGDGALSGPWWTRFRSPEMNRLIAAADVQNLDLAAATARLSQADAQVRIAGSALFPLIGFNGDAQDSQSSGTSSRHTINQPSFRRNFTAALSASYIVDIWGRLQDTRRAAALGADAADYARDVIRSATEASVADTYLVYVANTERLRVAQDNLRNGERILTVIQDRLKAGTGTALDVAQQEALVAGQRATLPQFREAADNARTALALLLGRPPQGFRVKAAGLFALAAPTPGPGLPADLLLRRPDIRQTEFALASAEANVDAARKALLPTIDLTGQAGFQSARLVNLLRPESFIYSAAAGLAQTVFDGDKLRSQVVLSDAQRQELLENYRKAVVSALTDVENALTALREGGAREAARRVAVDKARIAFRLAEERLRQGTIDLVTVLNTQQTLNQTQDQLIQDRLSRLQASVALFQALGGDWTGREDARRSLSQRIRSSE